MAEEEAKLMDVTATSASTSSSPSPMKPRSVLHTHDEYLGTHHDSTDSSHTRSKSSDMRLAASLRDSDLAADDAGNADKPMRRSVSWPDWSENSDRELVKVHRVQKYLIPDQRRSRAWFDVHRDTLLRMFVIGVVFLVVLVVILVLFIVRVLLG